MKNKQLYVFYSGSMHTSRRPNPASNPNAPPGMGLSGLAIARIIAAFRALPGAPVKLIYSLIGHHNYSGGNMIEPVIPAQTLGTLANYLIQWLQGLLRASKQRKIDCLTAIDGVISGIRQTQAYCRARDEGKANPQTEANLAAMWTQLGFELDALGIKRLAKRCDVKGRYWASPKQFSEEWWDLADIELDSVDQLARRLKAEIKASGY